jgi:hypothetical protein
MAASNYGASSASSTPLYRLDMTASMTARRQGDGYSFIVIVSYPNLGTILARCVQGMEADTRTNTDIQRSFFLVYAILVLVVSHDPAGYNLPLISALESAYRFFKNKLLTP